MIKLSNVCPYRIDSETVEAWQGCQQYYYRCVARNALFKSAMEAPSKELGLANIDRCRGFIGHLTQVTCAQQAGVAQVTTDLVKLR